MTGRRGAPPSRRLRAPPALAPRDYWGCPAKRLPAMRCPIACRVSRVEPDAPRRALPSCAAAFMAQRALGAAGSPSAAVSGSVALVLSRPCAFRAFLKTRQHSAAELAASKTLGMPASKQSCMRQPAGVVTRAVAARSRAALVATHSCSWRSLLVQDCTPGRALSSNKRACCRCCATEPAHPLRAASTQGWH